MVCDIYGYEKEVLIRLPFFPEAPLRVSRILLGFVQFHDLHLIKLGVDVEFDS